MPARKTPVTQAELRRYLKAMREAGVAGGRIEIERLDGTKVSIFPGQSEGAVYDEIDNMIHKVPNP